MKEREGRERRREGEARRVRKALGRSRSLVACRCPPAISAIATCVIPGLLLKYPVKTFVSYV
jgi:hypothetical protein